MNRSAWRKTRLRIEDGIADGKGDPKKAVWGEILAYRRHYKVCEDTREDFWITSKKLKDLEDLLYNFECQKRLKNRGDLKVPNISIADKSEAWHYTIISLCICTARKRSQVQLAYSRCGLT